MGVADIEPALGDTSYARHGLQFTQDISYLEIAECDAALIGGYCHADTLCFERMQFL